MIPMLSNLFSSESLMAGAELLRERDEKGLGSCGGLNAADEDLLQELCRLQDWVFLEYSGLSCLSRFACGFECVLIRPPGSNKNRIGGA